jgi:hypothetical protein
MESLTFFDTIFLGFLDDVSFHGTPAAAAEVKDKLMEQVENAPGAS